MTAATNKIAQQIREQLAKNSEECKRIASGLVEMNPAQRMSLILKLVGKQIRLMSTAARAIEFQGRLRVDCEMNDLDKQFPWGEARGAQTKQAGGRRAVLTARINKKTLLR